MSQWVDVSHDFGQPIARIRIGMRGISLRGISPEMYRASQCGPDMLRKFMELLITDERPQMRGMRIVAMEMRRDPVSIDVLVTHELLRPTKLSDEPPCLPLFEDGEWSSNWTKWSDAWSVPVGITTMSAEWQQCPMRLMSKSGPTQCLKGIGHNGPCKAAD